MVEQPNDLWTVGSDGRIVAIPGRPAPDWHYDCGCSGTAIQFVCTAGCWREYVRQQKGLGK